MTFKNQEITVFSSVNITLAEETDAHKLKTVAMSAFKGDLGRYGHHPPKIDSIEWHKNQINKRWYYKIQYGVE